MIGLIPVRVWIIGGLVAALISAGGAWTIWNRSDAVNKAKEAEKIQQLKARIAAKEKSNERQSQIKALSDCELERDALVRLSRDASIAGAVFQRCIERAAKDRSENDLLSGPQ